MPATFVEGPLKGLVVVEPRVFADDRGHFFESFRASEYAEHGLPPLFVQDNQSRSRRGVLRGLHWQVPPHAQGKLVRVVRGAVWDVAVDLRADSATYGQWFGLELSADNGRQLYIPPGFAHGFLTLSDEADLQYKCTAEYHPASEAGLRWDDPSLAISWPPLDVDYRISEKDAQLPYLKKRIGDGEE